MAEASSKRSRRAFLGGLTAAAIAVRAKSAGAQDELPNVGGAQPHQAQPHQAQPHQAQPHQAQGHQARGSAQPADSRAAEALKVRARAAELSAAGRAPVHTANGDERRDIDYALSFTKGLPHNYRTGLVERPADFERFVQASNTGDRAEIQAVPLGPRSGAFRTEADNTRLRGWETQSAGLAFDLVGYDAQALTMPPAPPAGSNELTAELGEVYAQAVLRDVPLTSLRHDAADNETRDRMLAELIGLPWFDPDAPAGTANETALARRRVNLAPQTAFRGIARGDSDGPYVSQLLLIGSSQGGRNAYEGIIDYGAQTINQRVRQVDQTNFMTTWDEWFDVQNALLPAQGQRDTGARRFITTGRDLATYVHTDALYQPYLNACLVLLSNGFPLDPSLPYQGRDDRDHQQGFVLYSAQHVLSMLVEVCGRALKTVAFQKFNVHRRLRPEALAARIEKSEILDIPEIEQMADQLGNSAVADEIRRITGLASGTPSLLLPMAFAEGSPMHPAYGAGHGTVAGACVTVLKTFFDHTRPFAVVGDASTALVPTTDGSQLATVDVYDRRGEPTSLTVEGELNKLAANVAIGRNWAGVHYFSDYWESLLLGEQVAIQIMREHSLTLPESFRLRVPKFDGSREWL